MKTLTTNIHTDAHRQVINNKSNKAVFNKSVISLVVIASLVLTPLLVNAEEQQQQENMSAQTKEEIGFGTGVVIGGLLGGPVGAFFTGIAGNYIAKYVNSANNIEQLELALLEEKTLNQQKISQYQHKLQRSEQAYQTELLALSQTQQNTSQLQAENLLMSLQFSTGSSELQAHYQGQIVALAQMLEQSPKLTIDLSGYTDLQGDEARNHTLSIARANAVKNALIDNGVESERIRLYAFGEKAPVIANAQQEASFYDRRVVIKLYDDTNVTEQTASAF